MKIFNLILLAIAAPVIIVIDLLLLPFIVEWGIEKAGTAALGARVEMSKAKVSAHQLQFQLINLEVTNPNDTMKNIVQIDSVTFKMNLLALLESKTVIETAAVDNLRIGTPRRYDGAVRDKKKQSQTVEQKDNSKKNDF